MIRINKSLTPSSFLEVSWNADISLSTKYIIGAIKQYYFLSACNLLLTHSFLFAHLKLMQLYVCEHMRMKQQ